MSEWKTYRLEELCTAKGSYGIGAPAVAYDANKYTYLRITDINDDGTLNRNGLMSVDDEHAEDYILKENDIVFARTGNSTGRTYFYDGQDGELVYAGFLIKFSLDSEKVNPRILKYYTHSQPYYNWVRSFDTGGTRGNINAKVFGAMPITLPPRRQQDRIVEILKPLDDKIELNRRINANLEAQAQALFRSWFVDFEPFRDGPFVDSELGKIPQGWKVGMLSDIAQVIKAGITPSASTTYNHYSIPAYDDAQFPEKQSGETIKSGKYVVYDNSVLLSKLNPRIKRLWFIKTAEENAICSTEFIPIQTYNKDLIGFVFYLIDSDAFYQQALSLVNGATGSHQRFHADDIMQIPFAWNEDVAMDFAQKANYILQKIEDNIRENQTLAALRDTLLPKLIV